MPMSKNQNNLDLAWRRWFYSVIGSEGYMDFYESLRNRIELFEDGKLIRGRNGKCFVNIDDVRAKIVYLRGQRLAWKSIADKTGYNKNFLQKLLTKQNIEDIKKLKVEYLRKSIADLEEKGCSRNEIKKELQISSSMFISVMGRIKGRKNGKV